MKTTRDSFLSWPVWYDGPALSTVATPLEDIGAEAAPLALRAPRPPRRPAPTAVAHHDVGPGGERAGY
ncbi:MAG: hypothetical protein E4H28_05910 [Gemmatimonadales bacterium]|nr:MAG: hypothetical protein E4H28_05910 [Gemmatimonadales bacterium]